MERETRSGPSPQDESPRSTAHTVWFALRSAQMILFAGFHLAFIVVAMLSELGAPLAIPVVAHAGAVLACLAVWRSWLPTRWAPAVHLIALGIDIAVVSAPDSLLFGLCSVLVPLCVTMPIILEDGIVPIVMSATATAAYVATMLLLHADWGIRPPLTFLVASAIFIVVAYRLMGGIRGFAQSVDDAEAAAAEEERLAFEQRATVRTAAEFTRLLHDTVINTFSALAREHPRGADPDVIRERCQRDLEHVDELHEHGRLARGRDTLLDLNSAEGIRVHWDPGAREALRDVGPLLDPELGRALDACAAEAVRNAAKHAGVDVVRIDAYLDDGALVLTVEDEGRGFDGRAVPGRGLAESVIRRADAHGIDASVRSQAGVGTTVSLRCPLRARSRDDAVTDTQSTRQSVRGVLFRGVVIWSIIVTGACILLGMLDPVSRFGAFAAETAIVVVLCAMAWRLCRHGEELPRWMAALIVGSIPIVTWLALLAASVGAEVGNGFQPLMLVSITLFVLIGRPKRTGFLLAAVLFVATVVASAVWLPGDAQTVVSRGILVALPVLTAMFAWYLFQIILYRLESRISAARVRGREASRQRVAMRTSQLVWRRWEEAGLEESLRILRRIVDGDLDPLSAETRAWCRDEERYLRQVCTVSSGSPLMSWWFARALASARSRKVDLLLQVENAEVRDQSDADAFGLFLVACVEAAGSESALTISMLPEQPGAFRVIAVGEADFDPAGRSTTVLRTSRQKHGNQVLVTAAR